MSGCGSGSDCAAQCGDAGDCTGQCGLRPSPLSGPTGFDGEFEFWPADWDFPPSAPWLGSTASRKAWIRNGAESPFEGRGRAHHLGTCREWGWLGLQAHPGLTAVRWPPPTVGSVSLPAVSTGARTRLTVLTIEMLRNAAELAASLCQRAPLPALSGRARYAIAAVVLRRAALPGVARLLGELASHGPISVAALAPSPGGIRPHIELPANADKQTTSMMIIAFFLTRSDHPVRDNSGGYWPDDGCLGFSTGWPCYPGLWIDEEPRWRTGPEAPQLGSGLTRGPWINRLPYEGTNGEAGLFASRFGRLLADLPNGHDETWVFVEAEREATERDQPGAVYWPFQGDDGEEWEDTDQLWVGSLFLPYAVVVEHVIDPGSVADWRWVVHQFFAGFIHSPMVFADGVRAWGRTASVFEGILGANYETPSEYAQYDEFRYQSIALQAFKDITGSYTHRCPNSPSDLLHGGGETVNFAALLNGENAQPNTVLDTSSRGPARLLSGKAFDQAAANPQYAGDTLGLMVSRAWSAWEQEGNLSALRLEEMRTEAFQRNFGDALCCSIRPTYFQNAGTLRSYELQREFRLSDFVSLEDHLDRLISFGNEFETGQDAGWTQRVLSPLFRNYSYILQWDSYWAGGRSDKPTQSANGTIWR